MICKILCSRFICSLQSTGRPSFWPICKLDTKYDLFDVSLVSFLTIQDMAQASAAANRIISLRSLGHDADSGSNKVTDLNGGAKIEFKSVTFKYPTRDVPVFRNLSFTVRKE